MSVMADDNYSPLVVGEFGDPKEVSGRLLSSGPELSAFRVELEPETSSSLLRELSLNYLCTTISAI